MTFSASGSPQAVEHRVTELLPPHLTDFFAFGSWHAHCRFYVNRFDRDNPLNVDTRIA